MRKRPAMNPAWMALSVAAMLFGAVILWFTITGILDLLRRSEVANLPAVVQQDVSFDEPGRYVLHIEQPRLNTVLNRAEFSLRDTAGGEVHSSPVIFRSTSSGFTTARISVRDFDVARPGVYRLAVTGIPPDGDVSRARLIFTRPFSATLFLFIVSTVFGGACLIGGLVFTALLYSGKL